MYLYDLFPLNDSLSKQSKIINYSKMLYLTENTKSYTATEDCWIFLIITSTNGTAVSIYIDNILLTMCGAASIYDVGNVTQYYPLGAIYLPKGSTISHNGAHEFNVRAFGC